MVRIQQINQSTKSKRNSNTGGIHQLPSGNWELRWYVTDESGNRKRVSTTVKGSKKNAQVSDLYDRYGLTKDTERDDGIQYHGKIDDISIEIPSYIEVESNV